MFWTLTIHPRIKTVKEAYAIIPTLWDAFRKEIQREQKRFKFLAFVEGQPQRNEMPHFHIIAFATVPKAFRKRKDPTMWIKDFAAHCGWGYQAKEEAINSSRASAYIAKYAGKGGNEMPKNFRRVRCSRSWEKPATPDNDAYLVRSIGELVQDYLTRVQEASNRTLDDLLFDYQHATDQLTIERLMNS